MSTQITNYYEIVSQLPQDASVTFQNVSWDEYEELQWKKYSDQTA